MSANYSFFNGTMRDPGAERDHSGFITCVRFWCQVLVLLVAEEGKSEEVHILSKRMRNLHVAKFPFWCLPVFIYIYGVRTHTL